MFFLLFFLSYAQFLLPPCFTSRLLEPSRVPLGMRKPALLPFTDPNVAARPGSRFDFQFLFCAFFFFSFHSAERS